MRKPNPENGVDETLKAMGYAPMPPEHVARQGGARAGKYLRVCGKGIEPLALSISTDLRNEAGLGSGTLLEIWYSVGKLAIVVGRGSLKLVKSGAGVRLSCPLLLAKVGATVGEIWPAEIKDDVIFVVIPGATERAARAAAENRRAQAQQAPR